MGILEGGANKTNRLTHPTGAGLQSEISPRTLTRVAQHQTRYNKHVEFYRTELRQKLSKVKDEQDILRKSIGAYSIKKKEEDTSTATNRQQMKKKCMQDAEKKRESLQHACKQFSNMDLEEAWFGSDDQIPTTHVVYVPDVDSNGDPGNNSKPDPRLLSVPSTTAEPTRRVSDPSSNWAVKLSPLKEQKSHSEESVNTYEEMPNIEELKKWKPTTHTRRYSDPGSAKKPVDLRKKIQKRMLLESLEKLQERQDGMETSDNVRLPSYDGEQTKSLELSGTREKERKSAETSKDRKRRRKVGVHSIGDLSEAPQEIQQAFSQGSKDLSDSMSNRTQSSASAVLRPRPTRSSFSSASDLSALPGHDRSMSTTSITELPLTKDRRKLLQFAVSSLMSSSRNSITDKPPGLSLDTRIRKKSKQKRSKPVTWQKALQSVKNVSYILPVSGRDSDDEDTG